MRTIISRALLLLSIVCTTSPALAETDEQKAMMLFEKGRKLAKDGRCSEAIEPLLESVRYVEGVGPLLNLGACYETIGKMASAYRHFARAEQLAAAKDDKRREEAGQRARAVEKDVPMITVHVPPNLHKSTEVRIDGKAISPDKYETPIPIDSGSHEIEVLSPVRPKQSETITIREKRFEWTVASAPSSSAATVPEPRPLKKPEAPSEPSSGSGSGSGQRTAGWVVGGFGAAGLLVGAIAGVVSISAHSSLIGRCPTYPTCDVSDRKSLDDMNQNAVTSGNVATIGIIAGVALLAGAAALIFTSR